MAPDTLLSDDLLRQLVAVGHVDVLVGIPTLNNAPTIAGVLRAVHAGLAASFPRARTVVIVSDRGSTDATPQLVSDFSADDAGTVTASQTLRTSHRITTPHRGVHGKGAALRTVFAAADLLSAATVAVVDPENETLSADRVGALAMPVTREGFDFVVPRYARAGGEALLITQLVRPLVCAAYGWRIDEPLVPEFACSGAFAVHCVEHDAWRRPCAADGVDVWLAGEALAGGFRTAQVALGPRVVTSDPGRPGLPETFQQVIGAVFDCLDMHAGYWLPRTGLEPVAGFGAVAPPSEALPAPQAHQMALAFAQDVKNLRTVLASILSPPTLDAVVAASQPDGRYTDDLWAGTVFECLLAHHRAVISREHVIQALLPLYLGRLASFWTEHAAAPPQAFEPALEALCLAFERAKPAAAAQWQQTA